jgi:anti-anti-sigma regulatory factor
VVEAHPGLCAVLEDAALRYANGQTTLAREALEQGLANDEEAKQSALAWLALFDVLQREGDRAAFDQLALQYVLAFERSAPSWEERRLRAPPAGRAAPGAYFALTGKLSSGSATAIANMLAATAKQSQVRLDLGSLTGADDVGARLLADALMKLRKRRYWLILQHPEKIRQALDNAAKQGRDAGEGYWTLLLELMQWQNDHKTFEDRALDFAIAFEVSPPSWEPPPVTGEAVATVDARPGAGTDGANMLVWEGTMVGPTDPQLAKLGEFREGRNIVPIDMSGVDRIDFVCAGHMLNAISRAESQRKTVQIIGASPIIRALLLLIGISSRHFIRKAQ